MTSHEWRDVLFGVAIGLLLIWLLLIEALAIPKSKVLQLEAAYRRFSSHGAVRRWEEKLRLQLLLVAVLIILGLFFLALLLSRGAGERAVDSTGARSTTAVGLSSSAGRSPASDQRTMPTSRTTPGNRGNTGSGPVAAQIIQLKNPPESARPFQTVRIQGTYRGGANTFVRVQRWEGGQWLAFPVPTKIDQSGRFIAYVELGQRGRYRLRVLHPDSGVTSKTFVLVVKN